jgi:hypothetical protein
MEDAVRQKAHEEEDMLDLEEVELGLQSSNKDRRKLKAKPKPKEKTLLQFNTEAARARQKLLDAAGAGMTDIEYRKFLQHGMHGDPDPDNSVSDITDDLNIQNLPSNKRKTAPTPNPPHAKRGRLPIKVETISDDDDQELFNTRQYNTDTSNYRRSRQRSQPSHDNSTNAVLLSLANLITAQNKVFTAYFKKAESPESELPLLYQTPNYIPQDANGNKPLPTSSAMDLRQSLWPHIEKPVIIMMIQSKLPIEKLHLLIPVDDRATTYEKGELSVSNDGMLTQTKTSGDMGKLNKQFPSKEMYIRAFTTWAAIKQAYNPDPSFSAALFMHINTMLTLTVNLEWHKVLRYELLFFRTHQTSKSTTIWAKVDTSLYVTVGLNSRIERSDRDKFTPQACLRYNRPGRD